MDIQELKKQLPPGAIKAIADRVQSTPPTVSQVLNGKIISKKQNEILQTTANYLKEYKAENKEAKKALEQALKL